MKRAVVLLSLAACGSDDAPPAADQLACNHFHNGPFQEDVIGDVRDSTAPEVSTTVVARLTDASGGGFAWFGAATAGDYAVYLNRDVDVDVTDGAGAAIAPIEDTASSTACSDVGHRVVVSVDVGVYYLELGVGTDTLDVIVEPVALDRD